MQRKQRIATSLSNASLSYADYPDGYRINKNKLKTNIFHYGLCFAGRKRNDYKKMLDEKFRSIEAALIKKNDIGNNCLDLANLLLAREAMTQENCMKLLTDWYFAQDDPINCLIACSYYCTGRAASEELFAVASGYYHEHIEEYKQYYQKNIARLRDYEWCSFQEFPAYEELADILLYQDETRLISINRVSGELSLVTKDNSRLNIQKNIVALVTDYNHIDSVEKILDYIGCEGWTGVGDKIPAYIYYHEQRQFFSVLQTAPLTKVLSGQRVVFLVGWPKLIEFQRESQVFKINQYLSGKLLSPEGQWEIKRAITKIKENDNKVTAHKLLQLQDWYKNHQEIIFEHIEYGKMKILFQTSRFSTAIQYHTRDCMAACEALGAKCLLLIEKSAIHRISSVTIVETIDQFRPDIIFCIDYFRFKDVMMPEIVHVCWAQDPMPNIMDKNTPAKLDENQYILAHYPNKEMLETLGYDPGRIMPAPISANHKIYRIHNLNEEELSKYQTDICLVANASCYETHIKKFKQEFAILGEPVLNRFVAVFDDYYQEFYKEIIKLDSREDAALYLRAKLFDSTHHGVIAEHDFSVVAEYFYVLTRGVILREVLVEWLIDGGYTNLKLYGLDWADNPKFRPYAMGMAENGESLAKIYQAAKITLGTNPITTGAARFYECYLSGGFYISNYIKPEHDIVNLRDNFKEGEAVPFYYGRQDLYDKIDCYLQNEQDRLARAQLVRQEMLKYHTYEALMRRMLEWLPGKVRAV